MKVTWIHALHKERLCQRTTHIWSLRESLSNIETGSIVGLRQQRLGSSCMTWVWILRRPLIKQVVWCTQKCSAYAYIVSIFGSLLAYWGPHATCSSSASSSADPSSLTSSRLLMTSRMMSPSNFAMIAAQARRHRHIRPRRGALRCRWRLLIWLMADCKATKHTTK